MADRERELAILLKAKADVDSAFSQLKEQLAGAESAADDAARNASKSWEENLAKIRNASAIAFAGVAGSIGLVTKSFMEQEDAENRARAATQISGRSWDEYKGKVAGAAAELQAVTRFGDEQTLGVFADLTLLVGDADVAFDNLTATMDLAAGMKMDTASAARAMSLVLQGEAGMLGRVIPEFRNLKEVLGENATESERAEYMLSILGQKFKGLAEEDAKTLSGSLQGLKNDVGDVSEALGAAFAPTITALSQSIRPLAKDIGEWAGKHQMLVQIVGLGAAGLTGFLATASAIGLLLPSITRGLHSMNAALVFTRSLMLTIPGWGWAIGGATAVIALTAAIAGFESEVKDTPQKVEKVEDAFEQFSVAASDATGVVKEFGHVTAEELEKAATDNLIPGVSEFEEKVDKVTKSIARLNSTPLTPVIESPPDPVPVQLKWIPPEDTGEDPFGEFGANLTELDQIMTEAHEEGVDNRIKLDEWYYLQLGKRRQDAKQQFLEDTDFLRNTQAYAVNAMLNTEMTGAQKRDAIWNQFKASVASKIAQVTTKYIWDEITKQAITTKTAAIGMAASTSYTATEQANSAKRTGSFMAEAYAKLVAFYAWAGPLAPAFAVGTIGVAIAGIGAIIARAMGAMQFQEGGVVPGHGFGDRVPALLESGEFVVNRQAAQRNLPVLEAMNNGRSLRGGNNVSIAINLDGQGIPLQKRIEIRDLVEEMLPAAIERALDDRRFSVSYAS
ncbi:hypothetical protein KJZ99_04075 [bacterium]|nr:hypothetical protein [bacterium]